MVSCSAVNLANYRNKNGNLTSLDKHSYFKGYDGFIQEITLLSSFALGNYYSDNIDYQRPLKVEYILCPKFTVSGTSRVLHKITIMYPTQLRDPGPTHSVNMCQAHSPIRYRRSNNNYSFFTLSFYQLNSSFNSPDSVNLILINNTKKGKKTSINLCFFKIYRRMKSRDLYVINCNLKINEIHKN